MPNFVRLPTHTARRIMTFEKRGGAAYILGRTFAKPADAYCSTKTELIAQARWSYTPGTVRLVKTDGGSNPQR